ncbi:uncharacterized protein LAESUDRAFT_763322 [Laetiporus sulphureus 93-53]|uniref:DUF4939 domain-containing protein n=1 Tax=Laetiporus sulphureus 93-53 TaxID=1314785 RepID=A0A165BYJ5_9APHY|nr:uncharacterized protein LAESUDRAFT_763322 [Laetiporus sulphureus 93-53]KZT01883.1 hypothetical protein LAESUDRAFT_763322 [Laetiporus sulphureus 93-53]
MSQYNLGGVAFPEGHTMSEPTELWRSQATSTSSEAGPAAPAEEPHTSSTPKASGVVRNPSPTTLLEFTTPQTWEWQGISYDTIEDATNAAAPTTVPNDVKEWVMNVVRAFIMRDVVSSYEALHQKMDERHERTVASLEEEILACIHVEIMAVETRDQLKVARAQIGTLSTDNERLIKSNNSLMAEAQAICKDFEDYKDEKKTTTYIVGLESQLNNAIINAPLTGIQQPAGQSSQSPHRIKLPDPPKYSGRKSSKNFETWFTNLLIWLDYNHFTDDKDKIWQANVHLEGGAALYMKEYAIKLASRQNVDTWAEYT